MTTGKKKSHIHIDGLDMAYGDYVVMQDLNFEIQRGEVFVIMGGSGCGKSTLLKHMIGLKEPRRGKIWYNDADFVHASDEERDLIRRRFGITFQDGALWSWLTLEENVALPISQYTDLKPKEIAEVVDLKLSQVGLKGFGGFYPSEISGGMRKRAGLARAMALDPEILFFDEPSAGLDPINSKHLDDLILQLKESLSATFVVVTHELSSIFDIADNAIFLDAKTKRQGAYGNPRELLKTTDNACLIEFLTRGKGDTTSLADCL